MKYRRVPDQVDAVQWKQHGDHPHVVPLGSPTLHNCGKAFSEHGHLQAIDRIVCPGEWIVTDHGVSTVWSDADFHATFELGPHF